MFHAVVHVIFKGKENRESNSTGTKNGRQTTLRRLHTQTYLAVPYHILRTGDGIRIFTDVLSQASQTVHFRALATKNEVAHN